MDERRYHSEPLHNYFREQIHETLVGKIGLSECDDLEAYLAELLTDFARCERLFSIRNAQGRPVESIAEMLVEGDVRLNADSFEREREVHRHIGDFLLFWSGLFPEALKSLRGFTSNAYIEEAIRQGSYSYEIVSSFDHAPYSLEALTFRKLSAEFPACQYGLKLMRASFEGFRLQGWDDGFQA